jgi:hypothetical protein
MNDGLRDVMCAAVRTMGTSDTVRRILPLRAVETSPPSASLASTGLALRARPGLPAPVAQGGDHLGRDGLRLAFWLCGFHDALAERRRNGETLTGREDALLALSHKDFAELRPLVIDLALARLHGVVNAPDPQAPELLAEDVASPLEAFALHCLRTLADRAAQLRHDGGPEAALSLFGDGAGAHTPLAIFQMVFTTALGVAEGFHRTICGEAARLARLMEALGSEVERI